MLRVFFGEDTFRSRAAYVAAKSETQRERPVRVLRDELLTEERLASALLAQPLFGSAPALALEGVTALPKDYAERVVNLLKRRDPAGLVLVWESGVPEGRSAVWTFLRAHADGLESFAALTPEECAQWLTETLSSRGGTMEPAAVTALLQACGHDLWTISQEAEKLVLYARGRVITLDDVRALTFSIAHANTFATVRALATGDGRTALRYLAALRQRGEDPRGILSLSLREIRLLLLIRDLLDRRVAVSPSGLARDLRIPAFAAEALLRSAKRTTTSAVRALFDRTLVSLYALNTGRADPDDVLDMLVFPAASRSPRAAERIM